MNNSDYGTSVDAIKYDTGYLVNGAIGLKMESYRVEAEVGYHSNDFDQAYYYGGNDKMSIWSFMANAYYDFKMSDSDITPYIMGGLGVANVQWSYIGGNNDDDTAFAWQVGAGVGFKATDKITVDVGYRYFATGDVNIYGGDITISKHNVVAGLRFDI